jgi:hypothetical protein
MKINNINDIDKLVEEIKKIEPQITKDMLFFCYSSKLNKTIQSMGIKPLVKNPYTEDGNIYNVYERRLIKPILDKFSEDKKKFMESRNDDN